ncbi:hypothetical protein CRG98_014468 [Punica granatum]|uniref:Uncharacterized protein n=1 Tax=Punica granatum TaxID=22663 RepID=A0A2I0K9F4_PUNGR|nr:hypothetical protein CRG98_014468 [Punica granatum]
MAVEMEMEECRRSGDSRNGGGRRSFVGGGGGVRNNEIYPNSPSSPFCNIDESTIDRDLGKGRWRSSIMATTALIEISDDPD